MGWGAQPEQLGRRSPSRWRHPAAHLKVLQPSSPSHASPSAPALTASCTQFFSATRSAAPTAAGIVPVALCGPV